MKISVSVNNERIEAVEGTSLAELLSVCGFTGGRGTFAVALNCTFVPREDYATRVLSSGDEIDVVVPIAGG